MRDLPWKKMPIMLALWVPMFVIKLVVGILGWFIVPLLWKYRTTKYNNLPTWTRPWSNVEDWEGQPNAWGNSLPKWWIEQKIRKVYAVWWYRPANFVWKILPSRWRWTEVAYPYSLKQRGAGFLSFWQYTGFRNGANGLRTIPPFRLSIDMEKVDYESTYRDAALAEKWGAFEVRTLRERNITTAWYFAWQGWKAGVQFVHIWNDRRHVNIKLGWRVAPLHVRPMSKSYMSNGGQILLDNQSFAGKVLLYRKG